MQQLLVGQIVQICCDISSDTEYRATTTSIENSFICYIFKDIGRRFQRKYKIKLSFEIALNGDEETRSKLIDTVNELTRFYRRAIE